MKRSPHSQSDGNGGRDETRTSLPNTCLYFFLLLFNDVVRTCTSKTSSRAVDDQRMRGASMLHRKQEHRSLSQGPMVDPFDSLSVRSFAFECIRHVIYPRTRTKETKRSPRDSYK